MTMAKQASHEKSSARRRGSRTCSFNAILLIKAIFRIYSSIMLRPLGKFT